MMKKIALLINLSIILLITSCNNHKVENENTTAPISIIVGKVGGNNITPFLSVSGTVQAKNSATLSTRMMGFIENITINVGDKVQKGQLLLAINNTDLQAKKAQVNASINEAKAAFKNAELDYNRFKNLFAENSATQKEVDNVTAGYEMAKARLEAAQQMKNEINAQFAYTNIVAPFSGIITSKSAEKGTMANPGQPLISLEQPGEYEVMAMVPETEISEIKKGSVVTVIIKSINTTMKGSVEEISTSAKETGGQFLVKIKLEKSNDKVRSGMFASIQFPVTKKTNTTAVLIPTEALITNGQLTGVYTISQTNTAILRWLRLGKTFGDQVEVLSGLNAEESYIVSAKGKLYNGAKIIPSSSEDFQEKQEKEVK